MGKENAEKYVRTGTDCKVLDMKCKPANNISTFPVLRHSSDISYGSFQLIGSQKQPKRFFQASVSTVNSNELKEGI